MLFYPNERVALFIDGANTYGATRHLGWDVDYSLLLKFFATRGRLLRAHYYTALRDADTEYNGTKLLVDWLSYNGFAVVTKPLKEYIDAQGRTVRKGNMDIEIAIDMLTQASQLDHLILFSGDGDFCRLIEALQSMGKRISVVSTIKNDARVLSDDLRRLADNFIDLDELREAVARPPRDPAAPRKPSARPRPGDDAGNR